MDMDVVRKTNPLELLEDEHPEVVPPPEGAAEHWSEAQIRQHFQEPTAGEDAPRLIHSNGLCVRHHNTVAVFS